MDLTTDQDVSIRMEAFRLAPYTSDADELIETARKIYNFLTAEDVNEVE